METWMIVIAVVVLIALAVIVVMRLRRPSDAVSLIPGMVTAGPLPAPDLAKLLISNCGEYSKNAFGWSFAYFGSVFGSAFLSAMAALILKLNLITNGDTRADAAAACATFAALLVTLSTVGDFKRKWQASRTAEVGVENLAYNLLSQGEKAEANAILDKLTTLNTAYNLAIEGNETQPEQKDSDKPEPPVNS